MAALRVVLVSYPVALTLLLVLALIVGGDISHGAMIWGGLCGFSQAFGIWWFYAALGSGPISVVSPLTAILVAAIPVGVGLALGERPGAIAGVGVVLALVAVVLVSRETTDKDVTPHRFTTKVAWLTVGAGVAFGLNFVLIAQAPPEANLWPLVFARLAATLVVVSIAAVSGNLVVPSGQPLRLALLGRGAGRLRQHRDAPCVARIAAVAGRCAHVAVSGGHGVARDRGAAGAGDPLAGRRHGARAGGGRHDRGGLSTVG